MISRLVVSGVLACALLGGELAASASARAETFNGRTAQGHKIKVRKQGKRAIKLVRFNADLNCRDGSALLLQESGFLPTRVRGNGSFNDVQYGRTDTVRFKGKVTGNKITGRLRLEDKLGKKKIRCTSRWIKFTAKR